MKHKRTMKDDVSNVIEMSQKRKNKPGTGQLLTQKSSL